MEKSLDTWAVVATGQSLKKEDVDYLRGRCCVAAVSNAFELAPWADALISHDGKWWQAYPEALKFTGRKFCRNMVDGTEQFIPPISGCNSGLMAMCVAKMLGAKRIILVGIDMHGTHYFGRHHRTYKMGKVEVELNNTTANRFKRHLLQFKVFQGPEVVNCNPESALQQFPFGVLRDLI